MLTDLNQVVWPVDFSCTLITDTLVLPNFYNITISVEPIGQPANSIDTTVVHLPTDPYDFYVGAILYTKFLKITEKYFHINHLTIDSIVGDRVQYSILHPEEAGLDLEGDHWWNTDSVNTGSGDNTTWEELNISDGPRFEPRIIKGGLSEQ